MHTAKHQNWMQSKGTQINVYISKWWKAREMYKCTQLIYLNTLAITATIIKIIPRDVHYEHWCQKWFQIKADVLSFGVKLSDCSGMAKDKHTHTLNQFTIMELCKSPQNWVRFNVWLGILAPNTHTHKPTARG